MITYPQNSFLKTTAVRLMQMHARWNSSFDEQGNLKIQGIDDDYPATQGFTSFEDYYKTLSEIQGYPSLLTIKLGRRTN